MSRARLFTELDDPFRQTDEMSETFRLALNGDMYFITKLITMTADKESLWKLIEQASASLTNSENSLYNWIIKAIQEDLISVQSVINLANNQIVHNLLTSVWFNYATSISTSLPIREYLLEHPEINQQYANEIYEAPVKKSGSRIVTEENSRKNLQCDRDASYTEYRHSSSDVDAFSFENPILKNGVELPVLSEPSKPTSYLVNLFGKVAAKTTSLINCIENYADLRSSNIESISLDTSSGVLREENPDFTPDLL